MFLSIPQLSQCFVAGIKFRMRNYKEHVFVLHLGEQQRFITVISACPKYKSITLQTAVAQEVERVGQFDPWLLHKNPKLLPKAAHV